MASASVVVLPPSTTMAAFYGGAHGAMSHLASSMDASSSCAAAACEQQKENAGAQHASLLRATSKAPSALVRLPCAARARLVLPSQSLALVSLRIIQHPLATRHQTQQQTQGTPKKNRAALSELSNEVRVVDRLARRVAERAGMHER